MRGRAARLQEREQIARELADEYESDASENGDADTSCCAESFVEGGSTAGADDGADADQDLDEWHDADETDQHHDECGEEERNDEDYDEWGEEEWNDEGWWGDSGWDYTCERGYDAQSYEKLMPPYAST